MEGRDVRVERRKNKKWMEWKNVERLSNNKQWIIKEIEIGEERKKQKQKRNRPKRKIKDWLRSKESGKV